MLTIKIELWFTTERFYVLINPDKGITRCNQQTSGQGHYFLPRRIHGRYSPHQQLLQPETFAQDDLDIMHQKPILEFRIIGFTRFIL
jgi:hypothetical protein